MIEVAAPAVAENTDVSDEQVTQFFETGGNPEPKEEKQEDQKQESAQKDAPKEEPKEEAKDEAKPSPEENYKKAMQEERMRRKQEQTARRELEAKVKAMEERFQQLMQAKKPLPDITQAPVENLDARLAQFEEMEKQRQEAAQIQRQEHERVQESERILADYRDMANEFKESNPDFDEAYAHFVKTRIEEFKSLGYGEEEAANAAYIEEINIAKHLLMQGKNPAEAAYNMAKLRGWAKAQPKVEEKPASQAQKMEMLAKGTNHAKIATGASSSGEITLEALAEMTDEEFMKNWDKVMK